MLLLDLLNLSYAGGAVCTADPGTPNKWYKMTISGVGGLNIPGLTPTTTTTTTTTTPAGALVLAVASVTASAGLLQIM